MLESASVGADGDVGLTRVDAAWEMAKSAESGGGGPDADAAAARFIDRLLAEPLICPVVSDAHGEPMEAADGSFTLLTDERDGRETLVVFDTEERLAAHVSAPTAFVAQPGRYFFALAAERGAQISLNPDVAPSASVFAPQTVDAIAALIEATEEVVAETGRGGLEISAPGGAPETLMAALSARLSAAQADVREAWLFSLSRVAEQPGADGAADAGRLVLGLLPRAADRADGLRRLASELGRLSGALLNENRLDIAIFEPEDRILSVARRCGFGLVVDPARASA